MLSGVVRVVLALVVLAPFLVSAWAWLTRRERTDEEPAEDFDLSGWG